MEALTLTLWGFGVSVPIAILGLFLYSVITAADGFFTGDLTEEIEWQSEETPLDLSVIKQYSHYHLMKHRQEPSALSTLTTTGPPPLLPHCDPSVYLSIVIPAFNESQRLPPCLAATMDLLNQRKKSDDAFSYEVIVVDDGSNDDTSGVVMRMVKETKQWPANSVRVIKLKRNRGKGFSVRLGMLASRGHYVLMMDADGASRFEDMVSLERGLVPKLSTVSAKEERRKREVKDNIGEEGEGESTLESGDNGTQKSKFYERSKKHFKALFIDTDRCKFILCEFTFNETV
eukprot:GHVN01012284.1.p1 GENE.GHVN01012284.1~~GHVN01012284.1.p1  ORF type:complete len:288 (+),score=57.17 GHVN01012284.1:97-960(+)